MLFIEWKGMHHTMQEICHSSKISKNGNVWKALSLYLETLWTGAHKDIAALLLPRNIVAGIWSLQELAWIFHRLLQGTWSKKSSNSPGLIRLYKALKIRATNTNEQGEQSWHPARTVFRSWILSLPMR